MLFFEVFDTLQVNRSLFELFEETEVLRVTTTQTQEHTCVHLLAKRLLQYQELKAMERELQQQLFLNSGRQLTLKPCFQLSARYTPERIWELYRDSIFDEVLGEYGRLTHLALMAATISFPQPERLLVEIPEHFIYRAREAQLRPFLEGLFQERFSRAVRVSFQFRAAEEGESAARAEADGLPVSAAVHAAGEPRHSAVGNENAASIFQNAQLRREAAEAKRQDMSGQSGGTSMDAEKIGTSPVQAEPNGDGIEKSADFKEQKKTTAAPTKKGGGASAYDKARYAKKRLPDDPSLIYGRPFEGSPLALSEIQEEIGEVVVRGQVIKNEERETKTGKIICRIIITDFTDSIVIKLFASPEQMEELRPKIAEGCYIQAKGMAVMDTYERELLIASVVGVREISDFTVKRMDHAPVKRVELHAHTMMSDMDGVVDAKRLVQTAFEWGHSAVAITDHGVVQAFTDANHALNPKSYADEETQRRAKEFKVIYGMEAYLVDDEKGAVEQDKGQTLYAPCVVFDLETTGLHAGHDKIIEIGAVKVENGEITDRFSTFVDPQIPIPYEITKLTGITDDMVIGSAPIEEVLPEFLRFCSGCVLAAHNASFDVGFIRKEIERLYPSAAVAETAESGLQGEAAESGSRAEEAAESGLCAGEAAESGLQGEAAESGLCAGDSAAQVLRDARECYDATVVDTVGLARLLLPELNRFKLDTVAKALKISLENHHRAVDDAGCTAEIYLRFLERLNEKGLVYFSEINQLGKLSPEVVKKMPTYHAIILCKNDVGRVNLYKLVSWSHLDYYHKRPRIPKSLYQEYSEGLLIGSACEAGELYQALLRKQPPEDIARLARFYDYFEIQPLGNNRFMVDSPKYEIGSDEDLIAINQRIVALGAEYGKPVVATCDVHFLNPEDEVYRRVIMAGKGFEDADKQAPLYLRTTEEMLAEFSYLGAKRAEEVVITNTNLIASRIEKISPVRPDKCPPVIENSDQILREICEQKAHAMYGNPLPPQVEQRLERELDSIIKNGFAVMYIIAQKLVWKSNEDGYLVGSRGSVGSSFVATMAGITEVNPLPPHYYCAECHFTDFDSEAVTPYAASSGCDMPDRACPVCGATLCKDGHDIPFETFLGFYGDKEPDIDLNFSGEYQSKAHDYTEEIFGKGHTFRAGTTGTLAEKTAYGYVLKYFEERGIHKRKAEIERIVQGCVGVRRTTGQHPGGIIVLPHGEEIYSFTPVQHPANDTKTKIITTHFDYHSIDHNLLKLDILGHDDPTMIRMLEDLTGVDAKTIPMDDKKVLSLFAGTEALGITPQEIDGCLLGSLGLPELGTEFVMGMLRETKPKSFSDMLRISGLSHGTNVWLNNTQTLIADGKCTLSTAICTRDDIMTYLIRTGVENGLAFKIMESVRKGKGLTEEMEAAMTEAGVPDWYIWSCKQIKYMFPKAHACAYVMMAFRIAHFKIYYPLAYYAAYFSIRASAFDYKIMCHGRARMEQYAAELAKRAASNAPEKKLTKKEEDMVEDMKIVREMYARGFSFLPIDIYRARAKQFQIIDGKLMPSLSAIHGFGEKAAEQVIEAVQAGPFLSKEDFRNRCKVSATMVEEMDEMGLFGDLPQTNQISLLDFFHAAE